MAGQQTAKSIARLAMCVALRWGLSLVAVSLAFVLAQTFVFYHLPQPFTAFALSAIAGTFWYGGKGARNVPWLNRDHLQQPPLSAQTRLSVSWWWSHRRSWHCSARVFSAAFRKTGQRHLWEREWAIRCATCKVRRRLPPHPCVERAASTIACRSCGRADVISGASVILERAPSSRCWLFSHLPRSGCLQARLSCVT